VIKESVKQSYVILLIENDESDVFFFRRALSSCHFRGVVRVVGTAWQARDYMEGRGEFRDRSYYPVPHLVVCDLHLPGASGADFLKWIREHPDFHSLPIIVWTGSLPEKELQTIMSAGASSYQLKTPEFKTLCERVDDMLKLLPTAHA
jgi:CheY-like chemotaxis protein